MSEAERPNAQPILPDIFGEPSHVTAGFSRREGGVSQGPYRSLNLGLSTGDDDDLVQENRRRMFEPFGLTPDDLAIAGQVHGSEVLVVSEPGLYPGYDGLVTTQRGLALCITSADCAAVLLADPEAEVIGACHSGWRGTVENVVAKTVRQMLDCGARADHLRAYVSPCISTEHFEVGPEVARRFAPDYVVRRTDWPKPHVNLKSVIAAQLTGAGLAGDAIDVSERCTFDETDTFFSHRAENGITGRMMGFVFLQTRSQ